MNDDDLIVINGLKHGDNWSYKYLYDHYYILLCKIAYTFLQDDFLAQTIVNDLIIHIYEKRDTLVINASLRAYLIRAVRNRCINYLQSEYIKKETSLSTISSVDTNLSSGIEDTDHPLATLLGYELEKILQQALEQLSPECRSVFEKSRYEDKTYETIASEMKISINTVKYHIKNALSHLRIVLGKYLLLIISYFVNF